MKKGREISHFGLQGRQKKASRCRDFMAMKKSRKLSGFALYSYLKDSAFTAVKRDAKL